MRADECMSMGVMKAGCLYRVFGILPIVLGVKCVPSNTDFALLISLKQSFKSVDCTHDLHEHEFNEELDMRSHV